MVFYRRAFLQVSSSAGSVRGTQSQGSGGSRNPNTISAAPILGTSAITSPSGGKIFLKKFSKFYYSYIMAGLNYHYFLVYPYRVGMAQGKTYILAYQVTIFIQSCLQDDLHSERQTVADHF